MTSDMQNSSPSDAGDGAGKPAGGSGLPVRGLAMILIAVALLLAAWAVWSMLSDSDDSAAAGTDPTETTVASETTGTSATQQNTAPAAVPDQEQDRNDQDTPPVEGEREGNREDERDARDVEDTPAQPGGSAAAGTPVSTLHVLNNSTVSQLAARVADSLEGDYDNVESGNLPDVAIPKTTVYFTGGNPDAEKAARELADRVNGVAMERSAVLPEETEGEDAIVLVLVEDINL